MIRSFEFLVSLFLLVYPLIYVNDYLEVYGYLSLILFIFIGLLSFLILNSFKGLYSYLFALFNLVFFYWVPLRDLGSSRSYWGGAVLNDNNVIFGNILIVFSLLMVFSIRIFFNKMQILNRNFFVRKFYLNRRALLIFAAIHAVLILYLFGFDISSMLLRSYSTLPNFENRIHLLNNYFLRPFFAIVLFLALFEYYKSRGSLLLVLVLALLTVMFVFPISLPRFIIAFLWFPLLIIILRIEGSDGKIRLLFAFLFFFGFGAIGAFRDAAELGWQKINLGLSTSGAFDAYYVFISSLSNPNTSYGYNFLSNLLFFVPRVYFHNKSLGSGAEMAQALGLSFENISFPFIAEFYYNFSVFGVVLYGFITGLIISYGDSLRVKISNPLGLYVYLSFSMLFFFLLRGDFLTFISFAIPVLLLLFILKKYLFKYRVG